MTSEQREHLRHAISQARLHQIQEQEAMWASKHRTKIVRCTGCGIKCGPSNYTKGCQHCGNRKSRYQARRKFADELLEWSAGL